MLGQNPGGLQTQSSLPCGVTDHVNSFRKIGMTIPVHTGYCQPGKFTWALLCRVFLGKPRLTAHVAYLQSPDTGGGADPLDSPCYICQERHGSVQRQTIPKGWWPYTIKVCFLLRVPTPFRMHGPPGHCSWEGKWGWGTLALNCLSPEATHRLLSWNWLHGSNLLL